MLNRWTGMGRLTADPELRTTSSGIAVVSFTVAIERDYKDQSGTRQADFVSVVAWRSLASFIHKYFKKGQMIAVTGRLQGDKWTDDSGNSRISWKILADSVYFGGSSPSGGGEQQEGKELELAEIPEGDPSFELPF